MPSDRTKDALEGILLNIEAVAEFTAGMTLEQFSADRRTLYAVTRALEIISEASRRLPDDFKARHPDIRWRAVQDAGNVYRHTYSRLSAANVWDTAAHQLKSLRTVVIRELEAPALQASTMSPDTRTDEGSSQ